MSREKLVDTKVYDLAEAFIDETRFAADSAIIMELATVIQEVIEDFIEELTREEETDE